MPSWSTVVQGMSVHLPPMMGTGGSSTHHPSQPQTSATAVAQAFHPAVASAASSHGAVLPLTRIVLGLAGTALLVAAGAVGLLWRRRMPAGTRRRPRHT